LHKILKKGGPVESQGTSTMKKSALAFVTMAMASIAHAGSAGDFSLLHCGVVFGGTTLTYNTGAASNTKSKYDTRMNHVLGAAREEPAQFTPSQAAASSTVDNKTETRLPPKFTLATVGCSWR
jgi:hypothetical protein